MLHIESFDEPAAHGVLRGMFAARKEVFVDLLKWDVPVLDGRFEVDQFDGRLARYLILTEPDGRHRASTRLLPTTGPHILGAFYAGLCDEAPPMGEDIAEITRFCLDRRLRAAERRVARNTLVTALADHALTSGINSYTAIAELGWFQQILAFGWRCRPLGLPRQIEGKTLGALQIFVDAATPRLLEAAGIVGRPAQLAAA